MKNYTTFQYKVFIFIVSSRSLAPSEKQFNWHSLEVYYCFKTRHCLQKCFNWKEHFHAMLHNCWHMNQIVKKKPTKCHTVCTYTFLKEKFRFIKFVSFFQIAKNSKKHVSNVMKQRLVGAFSDLFFKQKPLQTL